MKSILFTLLTMTLIAPSSFGQLDSLQAIADTIQNTESKAEWLTNTGYDYYTINPEITETFGLQAIEISTPIDYTYGIARGHHIIGIAHWTQNKYESAMKHYQTAYDLYIALDDQRRAYTIQMNMGNIYGDLQDYGKSISTYKKVVEMASANNDSLVTAWVLNNIGTQYRKMGQFDSALVYLEKDLPYLIALGDTVGEALVNNNIAVAMNSLGKYEQAIQKLLRARYLLSLKESKKRLAEVYTNLASNLLELNEFVKGSQYLDSAMIVAKSIGSKRIEQEILKGMGQLQFAMGNIERGVDLYEQSEQLKDSISGAEVKKKVEILELKYEDERKQKQIALLEKQNAEERFKLTVVVISSIAAFLLLGLLIYSLRLNIKNARHRQNELEFELTQKRKELTSYALNFIQKNELMDELMAKVNDLRRSSDTDTALGLNRINHMISDSFRIDQDWENFKLMFEEVHPDFFVRLKDRFPELGNAELKLAALLRLNMNLKESSRVLGISPDSVKTARYRLRKKLNLEHDENLVDFFIKFDSELISV